MSRISEFKRRALKLKYNENQFDTTYDPYLRTIMAKDIVRKPTGIISNDDHEFHYCLWEEEHGENPSRIFQIMKHICSSGVISRCEQLKSRTATVDEIEMLGYYSNIRILNEVTSSRDSNLQSMEEFSSCFDTIFVNQGTVQAALSAAGSCIELVDKILTGQIMNGMAVVRPPGHNASPNGGMNKLCILNNAALAAEFAVQKHNLKRILIVDIDKEHGLGIQKHFYNRKNVLYFSIHRFLAKSPFDMEESDCDSIGIEEGLGFNINVPLTEADINNADYLNIFHYILLPIAFEYKPQLVILCAGFNTLEGAYDSDMLLTPPIFSYLVHKLSALAQSRLAVILEGGLCLLTISDCSVLVLKALLDDPLPPLSVLGTPHESVTSSIFSVIAAQKKFWKSISDYRVKPIAPFIKRVEKNNMLQPGSFATRNYFASEGLNKRRHLEPQNYHFYYALTTPLKQKLAIVYDYRMLSHFDKDNPNALERPERIIAIDDIITTYGIRQRAEVIEGIFLSEKDILKLHGEYYLNEIKRMCEEPFPHDYMSVYFNDCTYDCARLSAGSAITALQKVAEHMSQFAFAVVRPPGHHAEIDAACGFCIFNNIALTAKYALETYVYERILIVDFDIHHCNGTTNIFEDDNRVLVISLHRYDEGNFFPRSGDPHNIGFCEGKHYNVHVAWNHKGVTDAEYFAAFQRIVLPIAYQFNPQIILVSAGFDAAIYDPIGQCCLNPEMFGHLCHMLKGVCSKMVLVLEGGYCITSLSHSVIMSIKALLGDPPLYVPDSKTISEAALASIQETIDIHKNFWFFLPSPSPETSFTSLHSTIQTINSLTNDEIAMVKSFVAQKLGKSMTVSSLSSTDSKKTFYVGYGDEIHSSGKPKDIRLPKSILLWLKSFDHFSSKSSDDLSVSESESFNAIPLVTNNNFVGYQMEPRENLYREFLSSSQKPTTPTQSNKTDLSDYFKNVSDDKTVNKPNIQTSNELNPTDSTSDEQTSQLSPNEELTLNSSSCSLHDKEEIIAMCHPEDEEVLDEEEDPIEEEIVAKESFERVKYARRGKQMGFKILTTLSDIAEQSEFSSDNQSSGSKPKISCEEQFTSDEIDEEQVKLKMLEKSLEHIEDTVVKSSDNDLSVRSCGRFYI